MELLKRDNKIMRAIDRVSFMLLSVVLLGLSDGLSPEDVLVRVFINGLAALLAVALVLLVSMDVFEFMENNFRKSAVRVRIDLDDDECFEKRDIIFDHVA